jgi:hypothetical protein
MLRASCSASGRQRQGQTIDCWFLSSGALAWVRGDGKTWQWENLAGRLRAAPECVSRGREIDCFAASAVTGGGLGHLAYDGQDWGDWELLGGSNLRQKPACLAGPGQQISCVAQGTNNTLQHRMFD